MPGPAAPVVLFVCFHWDLFSRERVAIFVVGDQSERAFVGATTDIVAVFQH